MEKDYVFNGKRLCPLIFEIIYFIKLFSVCNQEGNQGGNQGGNHAINQEHRLME